MSRKPEPAVAQTQVLMLCQLWPVPEPAAGRSQLPRSMLNAKLASISVLAALSHATLVTKDYRPNSWNVVALCLWLAFIRVKGLASLERADLHHLSWGFGSIAAFALFLLYDPAFQVRISMASVHTSHNLQAICAACAMTLSSFYW